MAVFTERMFLASSGAWQSILLHLLMFVSVPIQMGSQVPPFKTQSLPLNEMWRRWPETSEWLVKGNSPNLTHHVVRRLKSHLRGLYGEEPCEGTSWKPQYLPTPTPSHEADASAATS